MMNGIQIHQIHTINMLMTNTYEIDLEMESITSEAEEVSITINAKKFGSAIKSILRKDNTAEKFLKHMPTEMVKNH